MGLDFGILDMLHLSANPMESILVCELSANEVSDKTMSEWRNCLHRGDRQEDVKGEKLRAFTIIWKWCGKIKSLNERKS